MLDIGLPKLDGIELAHALRQMHGHRVTLIACTGNPAHLRLPLASRPPPFIRLPGPL